jgi:hypothetical protein
MLWRSSYQNVERKSRHFNKLSRNIACPTWAGPADSSVTFSRAPDESITV